ncbi:MAG: hypothetical protein CMC15_15850, partial [Flavobacteriaceae bacterium]|nr:hypothetical protein [Flavobacteriaceae bacterium]
VEHNLAKVRVGRSNRLARSIISKGPARDGGAFLVLFAFSFENPSNFCTHFKASYTLKYTI